MSVALAAARVLPVAVVAPLGRGLLPRLVMAGVMTALVAPSVRSDATPAALAREVLMGLTLGLVAALPFAVARLAGAAIDRTRDPDGDGRSIEAVFGLLALALFAALDGPRLLVTAVAQSYAAVPAGAAIDAQAGLGVALEAGARLFAAGLALAAPALAAMLLAELILALVERAQPALVQVAAGASLRTLLVVALLSLGAASLAGQLWSAAGVRGVDQAVRAAAAGMRVLR
jgi:flagellar biosynthetic protein FliR